MPTKSTPVLTDPRQNPLTWLLYEQMVQETGQPIEFYDHQFLIDPMSDITPTQVWLKAAQVGGSVANIIKTVWAVKHIPMNAIYTLPTRSVVGDFVTPKVEPLIQNNRAISQLLGRTQNKNLWQIGDHFLYFRGSFEEREAISISADLLVNDEDDRSKQEVLRIYQSRLDASRYRWLWKFSNPSLPGMGTDLVWQQSDQKEWVVKCDNGHAQILTWPDNIDPDRQCYQCSTCHIEITNNNRRRGVWVAMKPNQADVSGYHLSQMMAPWIPAQKILYDFQTSDGATFFNFTLGLPYLQAETVITLQDMLNACDLEAQVRTNNTCLGVDVGHVKHFALGNEHGVSRFGTFEKWDDLEKMLYTEQIRCCVIDAHPDLTKPRELARKYPGRVFVAWYTGEKKSFKDDEVPPAERGVIAIPRTLAFDQMLADIRGGQQLFNFTPADIAQYAKHFTVMFKVIEETITKTPRIYWDTVKGKPDHWAHATVYFRTALQRVMASGGVVIRPRPKAADISPTISPRGDMPAIDIGKALRHSGRGAKGWRSV